MSVVARPGRRILTLILIAIVFLFAAFLVFAHRSSIAEVPTPTRTAFAAKDIERGRALALIGNCSSCHTAAGGRSFAGGVPIATQFGTLYGSNITPDQATGIGGWSRAAFVRAMREGVGRDGSHLYPAFPYDHFSRIADGDLAALYAYLMTRTPVRGRPPANRLIPPLGFRPLLAGWKLLFFRPAPFTADPRHDADWNHGAYLGEGLAHCGGCHSPRGVLGDEKRDHPYAGGWAEGWYAPPLNAASPAVRAWTVDRLDTYLRSGLSTTHAAAAGPMGEVAHNLSQVPDVDVRAIATYYAALLAGARAARREPALADRKLAATRAHSEGAALFAGACAVCHEPGAPMMIAGRPPLQLGTHFHEATPRDLIQTIIHGVAPPVGGRGPYMPGFSGTLTDAQVAQVTAYLQARYGTVGWGDLDKEVAKARKESQP
ncbi:MAG: c-type cytochrome [Janthinobacterium lividum]